MVSTVLDKDIKKETEAVHQELNWCSVSISEVITKSNRLEASVFGIEGKHAREVVDLCRWEKKNLCGNEGLTESYYCLRFKRNWVQRSEYPIFQPSQILEIHPKPSGFISANTKTAIDELRVKKGQLLLTRSGTIGKCVFVSNTLDNTIFSDDVIRITSIDKNDAGYIYAFLKSKIGILLVQTNQYGSVISHIEPEHLDNISVPYPAKSVRDEINSLVIKSFELRDKSNSLINNAEKLFLEALNLPDIQMLKPEYFEKKYKIRNFEVPLSKLENRLEGSFHLPITQSITELFNKNSEKVISISDNTISKQIILPGRFKRVYMEKGKGVVFFGGKQLYELDPSNKKYLSLVHHGERIKKELTLKENMIMITCSGTIGKVAMVPKHWDEWTANQHIIRIVPASSNIAGYLFTYLYSSYGQEMIKRYTYGSVVDEIDDQHVGNILVPILKDSSIQKRINDFSLKANQLRYEAYGYEQEALEMIDKKVLQLT